MAETSDTSPIGIAREQHAEVYEAMREYVLGDDTPETTQDVHIVAKDLAQTNHAFPQAGLLANALYEGSGRSEYKIDEFEISAEGFTIIAVSPPLKVRFDVLADSSQVALYTLDENTKKSYTTDLKPNVEYLQDCLFISDVIPMSSFSAGSISM